LAFGFEKYFDKTLWQNAGLERAEADRQPLL
jgi:hypothetical protein